MIPDLSEFFSQLDPSRILRPTFLMRISKKNKPFPGHYTAVRMMNLEFLSLANRRGVPGRFAKWDRLIATFCAASHRFDYFSENNYFPVQICIGCLASWRTSNFDAKRLYFTGTAGPAYLRNRKKEAFPFVNISHRWIPRYIH